MKAVKKFLHRSTSTSGVTHVETIHPSNKIQIDIHDTSTHNDDASDFPSKSRSDTARSAHQAAGGVIRTDVSDPYAERIGTSDTLQGGFFTGARNTNASHSVFIDQSRNTYENRSSSDADVLAKLKPVDRTGYYVQPCMEGTRSYIFEEIDKWLDNAEEFNILWLGGGPGAGKSSIASSIMYNLFDRRRLGSHFFFRRGDVALSDPTTLWRTVAYDLTKRDPDFAKTVVETLKTREGILEGSDIDLHFKFLIEEPMTRHYKQSTPPVILIDALDECGSDPSQGARARRKTFLGTLIRWSRLQKTFKLIVTGRDDRMPGPLREVCKQILLPTGGDVSVEASKDIHLFFQNRFSDIPGSSYEWPGEQILAALTTQAAGLFIWAETIMKLLEQGIPDKQLDLILRGYFGDGDNVTELYRQVLSSSFQDAKGYIEEYTAVVSAIVLAKTPFHIDDLHQFLSQPKRSVKFILDKLSSVVSVGHRVQIGHLSFTEFLCDPKRCPEEFFIDRQKESQKMAIACFERMKERLKFNICDLETSHLLNDEVQKLKERITSNVPDSLSYSCRFWATHLQDARGVQEGQDVLLGEIKDFFHYRFLFWLEVMSLIKEVAEANAEVITAMGWIKELDQHLSTFARDASRFIVTFETPISLSVPHIYLSALPFSPSNSLIAQHYQSQFPNMLSILRGSDENWSALVGRCRGHTGGITYVAFSNNGKWVASGSRDNTVRIWDVETGQVSAGPFESHTGLVSVAFSPDGRKVVSGFYNKTIRIWDVETGRVSDPSQGHASAVTSVAFSPDGKKVASGSSDKTICIWDVETGQISSGPFRGHTGRVTCIAFSPDGRKVASGSNDKTICIWDVETGQISADPFQGHAHWVKSVAFSPDGKRVVSCCHKFIRIWDVETGQLSTDPFQGHTHFITSVTFSPDGRKVVSGSDDRTVCIWDVQTGQVSAGPFKGHTLPVTSVSFSSDGRKVASGSDDKTICIWDVETGQVSVDPPEGHTDWITSIAFSPDGGKIVSGSEDRTICIWDVETGQISAGSFSGHTKCITSVAFSPDGRMVVSGSDDNTINIWDIETGQIFAGPFEGHTSSVTSVSFSSDGRKVASGSFDETICVWDVETGQLSAGPFHGSEDAITSVAFSPDGRKIVSGSYGMTLCIWDVETGQISAGPLEGHTHWITSVAFSPDGRKIVSGSEDMTICIWDVDTGQLSAGPLKGHTFAVTSVAFSPDGKKVVSGSKDTTICIWDVETRQVSAGPLKGHMDNVTSVIFSPDGRKVASGSQDRTIRIWDLHTTSSTIHPSLSSLVRSLDYIKYEWLIRPDPDHTTPQRLLWIPEHFRRGLWNSNTLLIIGAHILQLDLDKFVHGEDWTRCYSPQPMSSDAKQHRDIPGTR